MKRNRRSTLTILLSTLIVAVPLALAPSVGAHVFPSPMFVPSGGTATISLQFLNERKEPMTGFAVTVPDGLEIRRARDAAGWKASSDGVTATWRGGPLAYNAPATLAIDIAAKSGPGIAELETAWLYDRGEPVRWPLFLTVTPADETPSQNLRLAAVVGVVGLLVAIGVVILARARPSR